MKKIFIGVGHGGSDPGAVSGSFRESDLNLEISMACFEYLQDYDADVMISRKTDITSPLSDKIKIANNYNSDLAIDIHNNAGGGDGFEAYYEVKNEFTKKVSAEIEKEVIKIGQNSRGLKTKLTDNGDDWFGFLREVKAPSILLECAFVDNVTDRQILNSSAKLQSMGEAIAKGIVTSLNLIKIQNASQKKTLVTKFKAKHLIH